MLTKTKPKVFHTPKAFQHVYVANYANVVAPTQNRVLSTQYASLVSIDWLVMEFAKYLDLPTVQDWRRGDCGRCKCSQ